MTPTPDLLDFLALTVEPGIPSHALRLRVGAICTILRNLNIELGLVKNVRVMILKLRQYTVEVQVIPCSSNSHRDDTYSLPRITFKF